MPNPVRAIPEGYHTITPGLTCKNAAQAIDFYKSVFGAKEIMRMPGPGGMIMHAEIQIGDSRIMLAIARRRESRFHVPVHGKCGCDVQSCRQRRSKGRHATDGPILGRSLRQSHRPLRPPLGPGATRGRCRACRDAAPLRGMDGEDGQSRGPELTFVIVCSQENLSFAEPYAIRRRGLATSPGVRTLPFFRRRAPDTSGSKRLRLPVAFRP